MSFRKFAGGISKSLSIGRSLTPHFLLWSLASSVSCSQQASIHHLSLRRLAGAEMSSSGPPPGHIIPAPRRYFCYHCINFITINPSTRSRIVCPICNGGLIDLLDPRSLLSFDTSARPLNPEARPLVPIIISRGSDISRIAVFEHQHMIDDFVMVIWENGFFSPPYPDSMSVRNPPLVAGAVVSFWFLREYIQECMIEGAIMNISLLSPQIMELLGNNSRSQEPQHAPQSAIAALPDVDIAEDLIASEARCAVCLEHFKIEEKAKQLPCKHVYHKRCIVTWLERRNSCPVCRLKLRADEPENPPEVVSSASSGETEGTGEQNIAVRSSHYRALRFEIELLWPPESRFSRLEIRTFEEGQGSGGGGERNGEDTEPDRQER